jgi:hypothetical protein
VIELKFFNFSLFSLGGVHFSWGSKRHKADRVADNLLPFDRPRPGPLRRGADGRVLLDKATSSPEFWRGWDKKPTMAFFRENVSDDTLRNIADRAEEMRAEFVLLNDCVYVQHYDPYVPREVIKKYQQELFEMAKPSVSNDRERQSAEYRGA